jgi:hypothetical protein
VGEGDLLIEARACFAMREWAVHFLEKRRRIWFTLCNVSEFAQLLIKFHIIGLRAIRVGSVAGSFGNLGSILEVAVKV